jgi:threonine/homoserine/homoserine lactone efflux protein
VPDLATLLAFVAAGLALILVPGPNAIYIATRSIDQGRRAGVLSAFGVETGTLIHIAAAAAGVSAALASSAVAFEIVRWAGVAYLAYLGLRALRGGQADGGGAPAPRAAQPLRVYAEGVLVNALNPKVAIFFLAFLPQFVDPDRAAVPQVLVLGGVLATLGLAVDLVYAVVAGRLGERLRGGARRRFVTGGVYLALAGLAAASGGRRS